MSATAESPKVIQVVMHDVLRPDFTAWLNQRGLNLEPSPFEQEDDDELETWFVVPSPELWARLRGVL